MFTQSSHLIARFWMSLIRLLQPLVIVELVSWMSLTALPVGSTPVGNCRPKFRTSTVFPRLAQGESVAVLLWPCFGRVLLWPL